MSIFDAFRIFSASGVKVTCPQCAYVSTQSRDKIRQNITLVCPKCGHYFLPKEK